MKVVFTFTLLFLAAITQAQSASKGSNASVYVGLGVVVKQTPVIDDQNQTLFDKSIFNLVTHGRSGELYLDGEWRNAESIVHFIEINFLLHSGIKQLNIYGCEFGKGEKGLAAVAYLEKTLHLKVAASTDITGKDGDWILEIGRVDARYLKNSIEGNLQFAPGDDLDHDNVINSVDIDDDNDGVLDTDEMIFNSGINGSCNGNLFHLAGMYTTGTYNKQTATAFGIIIGNSATFATGFPVGNICSRMSLGTAEAGSTTASFFLKFVNPNDTSQRVALNYLKIISDCSGTNEIIEYEAFDINGNSLYTQTLTNPNPPVPANTCLTLTPPANLDVYSIRIRQIASSAVLAGISLKGVSPYKDYDTDADGIPNRLDLDSDGDGCSDALESGSASYALGNGGTTSSSSSTYSSGILLNKPDAFLGTGAPAEYGTNGLYNIVESGGDVPTATTVYTSSYKRYALRGGLLFCNLFDADGVSEIADLDDDNDGILDAVESPTCFYNTTEANTIANISSGAGVRVNSLDRLPGTPLPTLHNGTTTGAIPAEDGILLTSVFNPLAGANIFTIAYPTPVKATEMKLFANQTSWGTNSAAILRGSNDSVNWTTLSPSTPLTTAPTTKTFTVTPGLANEYQYYRIEGASTATSGNSQTRVFEITATFDNTGYIASAHPKATACTGSDFDGDGIANHLDLDTDGDGCPDAIEGGVSFTYSDLQASSIPGGNSGAGYTGSSTRPIVKNLGMPVGNTSTTLGVPSVATTGQTIGNSQNGAAQKAACSAPPVATNDTKINLIAGSTAVVNILSNDNEGSGPFNSASVQIAGSAGTGQPLVVAGQGTWSINASTGAISFTPQSGFTGDPTPISYTVSNADGLTSNSATVTLDFNPPSPPVAANDMLSNQVPGTAATINVTSNDTDGAAAVVSTVNLTGTGTCTDTDSDGDCDELVVAGEGIWTVNNSGIVTFTPEPGFTGDPTAISYTVKDSEGEVSNSATVSINYNNPPVAANDMLSNQVPGTAATINVTSNDTNGNAAVVSTVNLTGTGTCTDTDSDGDCDELVVAGEGIWTVNSSGIVTFTPEPGFTGDPTAISYTVKDSEGEVSNSATVSINYNNPPVGANDMLLNQVPGTAATINVTSNDTNGNAAVVSTVNLTGTGTCTDTDSDGDCDELVVAGEGIWTVNSSGIVTFTPEPGFTGDPTAISYTVKDSEGEVSNSAIVTLIYNGPLPVYWLMVSAVLVNTDALVSWKVMEKNVSHYLLQRSVNGGAFTTIGTVQATAGQESVRNYSFIDNTVSSLSVPIVVYRLVSVDFDGHQELSSVVSVTLPTAKSDIRIYPNPSSGSVNFSSLKDVKHIEIYNALGARVKYISVVNSSVLNYDISTLASGTYFIKLTNDNKIVGHLKVELVKQYR